MDNLDLEVASEGGEVAVNSHCASSPPQRDLKPRKGQEFETLDDVKNFYNAYAKEAGFSIRSWSTRKRRVSEEVIRKEYVCYKQGKSSRIGGAEKKKRRGTLKEGCNAKLAVVKSKTGSFVVSVFVEGHSHSLSTPQKTHLLRSHLNVSTVQKGTGDQRDKDSETKRHDGDMLVNYFQLEQAKDPSFTFKIEVDDQNEVTRCFWADATSRNAYTFYSDVVIFDTSYAFNENDLIFAAFMGVNSHGQTIIFACALVSDETEDTFIWLFNRFLEAMLGVAPKIIITDHDPDLTNAISQTLPSSFHRYCIWHILAQLDIKMDPIKYDEYDEEFWYCICKVESKKKFDLKWTELHEKSRLNETKWLKSLYEVRSMWVPAYVNHIFSAEMSSFQGAQRVHLFFEEFVFKYNSLVDFVIHFNKKLARQRHKELKADFKDLTEKHEVRLLHVFLLQMVDIYTHEMFLKFEDEFWNCLNYKFTLIKDINNHRVYQIQRINGENCKFQEILYDKDLDFASCSCRKFESSGILCRHILAYLLKKHDFDKLPKQYILKRWTKHAKSELVFDDGGMQMINDKSYLVKRSQLIQLTLGVIDMALVSEEATKIFTDGMGKILEEINQLGCRGTSVAGVSSQKSNQINGF